jgi:hypothetical protein
VNKKSFTILLAAFFIAIAAFHFALNFDRRNNPPSGEWAKEVLISSGNVLSNPSLIKYEDKYIVAHSDGDKIKILSIDKLGNKLQEKQFKANGAEPLSTNAVTNGKEIYLYWIISEAGSKAIYNVRLDSSLNILEESRIHGVKDIIAIGENVTAIQYSDNKIGVTDLKTGKSYSVTANDAEFLSGAKNKEGYTISFKEKSGEIKYFTIANGEASKLKTAGKLDDVSSIAYVSSTLTVDDTFGYLMMEYRYKGDFGGTKLIKFPLKEVGKPEIDDFKINNSKVEVLDVIPYYDEGSAKFLARKTRPYDKKRYYEDIVEYNLTNPEDFILVSRTKELSIYPAVVEDTVIFCDVIDKDKFNIYMTSKNEDFRKAHDSTRSSEAKLTLIDTISGLLFSIVYIIPYGALWIIPAIGAISLYTVFEYKISSKKKRIGFSLIYAAFFIFKSLGIRAISFNRFGRYMPEFMTFELSLIFSLAISLLCGIYAYKKYSDGIESNVGAISLTMPMVYDTILTLMLVVPFIV